MIPFALVCLDLDGTLIVPESDPGPLAELGSLLAASRTAGTRLAFATGRGMREVRQLVAAGVLPRPDFLLAELGTVVYEWADGEPRIAVEPAWSRWDGELVERLAGALPQLRPRLPERSGPFKKSFYVAEEDHAAVTAVLERELEAAGLAARILFVPPRYLHVVPEGSGKEAALRALAERLRLPEGDILVAGDSEVDRGLLEHFPHAILVGNAPETLKEEIRRRAPHVYVAAGPGAAGVLEGLEMLTRCRVDSDPGGR